jgi:hypothetical protein
MYSSDNVSRLNAEAIGEPERPSTNQNLRLGTIIDLQFRRND